MAEGLWKDGDDPASLFLCATTAKLLKVDGLGIRSQLESGLIQVWSIQFHLTVSLYFKVGEATCKAKLKAL